MKNRNVTFITILLVPGFLALSPVARGVTPAPDGGYPGGNTAEGQNALLHLNTGTYNTAVGFLGLESDGAGSFNTALGAGALSSNTTGFANTANGVFALFSSTAAADNTAIGASALIAHVTGDNNTALGAAALIGDTNGRGNTAIGTGALSGNTTGLGNVAVGQFAGFHQTTGVNNVYIGSVVAGVAGENNTIRIGDNLPQAGQSNCFIGGLFDGQVGGDAFVVGVNAENKVGDTFPGSASKVRIMDVIKDHQKVAELEATVAALTGQLKDQSAQIQKVNAQFEMNKPATRVASLPAVALRGGGNNP